jgi:hypothetical protein
VQRIGAATTSVRGRLSVSTSRTPASARMSARSAAVRPGSRLTMICVAELADATPGTARASSSAIKTGRNVTESVSVGEEERLSV